MTIKEMHYDFKKKLNKIDSQQNRNLLVPEIDWVLNEAQNVFVDIVTEPRLRNHLGFEKSQKTIDDIRTLVINDKPTDVISSVENSYIAALPGDYRNYIKSYAYISKGSCTNKKAKIFIREHDDDFQEDVFAGSSFEWRETNALFTSEGLKIFTDGTFTVDKIMLSYIKQLSYIHNAEDFRGSQYSLPSGLVLSGTQDCELPKETHREIVDIAVMITTGEIQAQDYQIKYSKLNLNNLK